VTHRCHNREFLLRFACDRDGYRTQEQFKREACWTEGLTVGSDGFVERIRPLILSRQETELAQRDEETWVLKDSAMACSAEMGSKNAPKLLNEGPDLAMHFVQRNLFWRQETQGRQETQNNDQPCQGQGPQKDWLAR
jgi:hypothetical protein